MLNTLLLSLILLISPTEKKNANPILKEIAVAGADAKEIIMNAQKISFSKSGSIYLTDKIYCRLNIYDKNLNQISSIGKKGKSLGEFKAPSQITTNEKYVVVSDFASSRVQVFNSNNKPLYIFYTDGPIFDMAFDRNGFLLIGVYTGQKDKTLYKYNINGQINSVINLKNTFGDPFKDIYKFTVLTNGYLAVTYLVQNVIEILDKDYKYVRTIVIDKLPLQPEYKNIRNGLSVPIDNLIQSVASDSKSRIYVLASHYVKNPKQEIYIYNTEGKFLESILLPFPADEIFIDSNSNLYSIEKNRTIFKKYKSKV